LAGGAVLGAAGSIYGGIEAKKAADFNARQLRLQAKQTMRATDQKVQQHRAETGRLLSTVRSRVAASGVRMAGTPLEAMAESRLNAAIDERNQFIAGQQEAARLRAEAKQQKRAGRAALIGGILSGAGQLLGGAGDIAGRPT
jgi:hypothetical protein